MIDRQLSMLEGLKNRQENCIEKEKVKEERSLESVNMYKIQLKDLQ